MWLQSRKRSPVCDKDELRQKEKEEERPGSLKANHNALPKSIPTLSETLSFPSFLRPAKMIRWIAMENLMLEYAGTQCFGRM
ncbi:hypothetical protein JHK82_022602 [Glycine max]|nr:hypothetical protein JHK86_022622 [Glycine max]KAG5137871.1 hypothetical protein JHK82_022602 [Glycine max]